MPSSATTGAPAARPVFFVSDHTGITAEIVGRSLLTQFPGLAFDCSSLAFVDSVDKARAAVLTLQAAAARSGQRPLVFSTLTDPQVREILLQAPALVLDLYAVFIELLAAELGRPATPARGRLHGLTEPDAYHARIEALNFTLATDDGLNTERYALADLVLIGVSRSGKTPTALYLAMRYGLRVANYPLTPECLTQPALPQVLRVHQDKLRGLTLRPERLAEIRAQRRPGSPYADPAACREEVRRAESIMRAEGIPVIDATHRSIEELAALLYMTRPQSGSLGASRQLATQAQRR
ncbi:MAG: kinase/pyrophosphorylase [Thiobacillaceae bacterium]|nr:kinase/pyrophosphorylase [Thiobacillaceae bacterium]